MKTLPSWLKRVISITALTLVVLFSVRACSIDSAEVAISFRLGTHADRVAKLECALLSESGDALSTSMMKVTDPSKETLGTWRIPSLSPGQYQLDIKIYGKQESVVVERTIHVPGANATFNVVLKNEVDKLSDVQPNEGPASNSL